LRIREPSPAVPPLVTAGVLLAARSSSTLARNDPGLLVKNDPVGARVIEVG
jgi:hypothetical protein